MGPRDTGEREGSQSHMWIPVTLYLESPTEPCGSGETPESSKPSPPAPCQGWQLSPAAAPEPLVTPGTGNSGRLGASRGSSLLPAHPSELTRSPVSPGLFADSSAVICMRRATCWRSESGYPARIPERPMPKSRPGFLVAGSFLILFRSGPCFSVGQGHRDTGHECHWS